jgi:hypothetical protein
MEIMHNDFEKVASQLKDAIMQEKNMTEVEAKAEMLRLALQF